MRPVASVDIVIPVLNEERALAGCVETLHAFLTESFPLDWRITVADNGSTDRTLLQPAVAARLPHWLPRRAVRVQGGPAPI
jgi:hypothetical protein